MFYQDMRHHACPHTNVSCEKGLEFIRVQVQALASALDDLGRYADEVKGQGNKGWSR
jgi:hypothetical protein